MPLKPPEAPVDSLTTFNGLDARVDLLEAKVPYSPMDYGAAGNGTTNDATPIGSAITAAAATGGAVIINRTYKVSSLITLVDNVTMQFTSLGVLDFSTSGLSTCIQADGPEGSTVAVNTVAEGALTITGSAGIETGISADDWLRLASADIYDPLRTSSPIGELVQVSSTAAGSITLRTAVKDTYTTTPVISKITMRKGISFTGSGRIIASAGVAISLSRCIDCVVAGSRLRFESTGGTTAVSMTDCVSCEAGNFDVSGFNAGGSGYGASFVSATRDCRVHHATMRNCRHSVTTANAVGRPGIARNVWFEDIDSFQSTGDDFDTHAAADGVHFRNCGSYVATTSGFNIECNYATVVGCTVDRPGAHGILANNATSRASDYTIKGNIVRNTGSNGIRYTNIGVAGAGSSQRAVRIVGNEIYNSTLESILVRSTDTWRTGRVTITGNTSVACQSTTAAIHFLKGDDATISGNVIEDYITNGNAIRLNDCTYVTITSNEITFASLTNGLCIYAPASTGNVTNCVISNNVGRLGGKGIQTDVNATLNTIIGNDFSGCTTPTVPGTGAANVFRHNRGGAISTVASAGTITLPGSEGDIYKISGVATVDTITATSMVGRTVHLITTSTATIGDSTGNVKLSAAFAGTADDGITLSCDGTNWFEVGARSVN